MGIMAGKTVSLGKNHVRAFFPDIFKHGRMAFKTEFAFFKNEEVFYPARVRIMALGASAFPYLGVPGYERKSLLFRRMAAIAEFPLGQTEDGFFVRGMGIVAGKAIIVFYGGVGDIHNVTFFFVAIIAKGRAFFFKYMLFLGGMGIVAYRTFILFQG